MIFNETVKKQWGFHPMQEAFYNALKDENENLVPARVTFTSHDHYRVMILGLAEEKFAKVRGHFHHENLDLPVVGDWVAVEALPGDHEFLPIADVLPRRTTLKRADDRHGEQILIANVDHICLVTSFNQDLNLRRLERGLAMIIESGANPLIVVNKSDLAKEGEIESTLRDLGERFARVTVVSISAQARNGLSALTQHFSEGQSVAFLGMSGVGKSTLINAVIDEDRLLTKEIRESDGRGQHTTTHRELLLTTHGFWLLDSPGIRTFAMAGDESALERGFDDIAELTAACRFGDCSHKSEPGCAVLAALQAGQLAEDRWLNYSKIQREMQFHANKRDKAFQSGVKKGWVKIHKSLRQTLKAKGKK